jgi:predicted RNA-binding protein with TRAM domain
VQVIFCFSDFGLEFDYERRQASSARGDLQDSLVKPIGGGHDGDARPELFAIFIQVIVNDWIMGK